MRLLWLKYGELLPVDTGGKLRSFNLLRQLGSRVDLCFVSYADLAHDPDYPARIAEVLPGSRFIAAADVPGWREVAAAPVLRSMRTGAPLNVSRFASALVRRQLASWLRAERFDVVLCDFLTPTLCLPALDGITSVLFEHNVESAVWARRARTIAPGPRRLLYEWEARATLRWERRMLHRFDRTLAVSEADRAELQALAPGARVDVVETGVDVAAFQPEVPRTRSDNVVVFLGSMDWQPNEDGVIWFAEAVWPLVRAAVPDAVFRVVGRRPSARVQELRGPGIEVTGDVVSVVPHLAEAALTVVPLRAGGGTRLKIFEAMAAGAPVVSTTLGAEGLPVVHDRDIVIADGVAELASAVTGLLGNRDRREQVAEAARRTAASHDWSAIAARLVDQLAA